MKSKFKRLYKDTCFNPCPLFRTIKTNFLRKRTIRNGIKSMLFSTSYAIFHIHKTAHLNISGISTYGFKKYKGSRLETSLWMGKASKFIIGNGNYGISIFHGVDIQIFDNAELSIGGKSVMNRNSQIICQEKIQIGDGCLISRDVVIRDNDGGHKIFTEGYKKTEPVIIGNHVWIGQGAMILKGSVIGDGAIIGAGAIIYGKIKPKSLVMADPSRIFAKDIEWKP